jgi:hypothetical protein
MQQFVSTRVTACRPCGRRLIRSYTGRTLWQGWWGAISFFFNWFVLMANAWAWFRLGKLENPSVSGMLITDAPRGFEDREQPAPEVETQQEPKQRSKLRKAPVVGLLGFGALALLGWGLDATDHGHEGGHGAPATAPMIERAMTGGPFTAEDGSRDVIDQAVCTGEGETAEAAVGLYTHFRCKVLFGDGTTDEVLVHNLVGDELFFRKETTGS